MGRPLDRMNCKLPLSVSAFDKCSIIIFILLHEKLYLSREALYPQKNLLSGQ